MGSGGAKGGGELGGAGNETRDGEVGGEGIGWDGHADGGGDPVDYAREMCVEEMIKRDCDVMVWPVS